jgi:hypothetical protein
MCHDDTGEGSVCSGEFVWGFDVLCKKYPLLLAPQESSLSSSEMALSSSSCGIASSALRPFERARVRSVQQGLLHLCELRKDDPGDVLNTVAQMASYTVNIVRLLPILLPPFFSPSLDEILELRRRCWDGGEVEKILGQLQVEEDQVESARRLICEELKIPYFYTIHYLHSLRTGALEKERNLLGLKEVVIYEFSDVTSHKNILLCGWV